MWERLGTMSEERDRARGPEPELVEIWSCPPACEHQWDGAGVTESYEGGGGFSSAQCSKCGVLAIDASMWDGP